MSQAIWRKLTYMLLSALFVSACAGYATIPISKNAEYPFFWVNAELDGKKLSLLLDTGSSYPVLSETFAMKRSLATHVRDVDMRPINGMRFPQPKSSGLNSGSLRFYSPRRLKIGTAIFVRPSAFIVADTSMLSQAAGQSVEGIIGGGILNGTSYRIDFPSRELRIGRFSGLSAPYPLEVDAQYLFADGKVNGISAKFLIDSGASGSTISQELANELGFENMNPEIDEVIVTTIEGAEQMTRVRVSIESFEFGSARFGATKVRVGDANVIGLDLLSKGILDVDPGSGRYGFVISLIGEE